jgi:serine/threonine protein phosphatase PrpC
VTEAVPFLFLRYAARSETGLVRGRNEDSAYAGPCLLAVADGMGGHPGGATASAAAVAALAHLDRPVPPARLADALAAAAADANAHLREIGAADPALAGLGTTLTAMLWSGTRAAVCHIGDSRAYLLRDGAICQLTRDHSLVQALADEGVITAGQAAAHPQRSWLLRVLDGAPGTEPDLLVLGAFAGDRYLLCSDGLSGVVSDQDLRAVLAAVPGPGAAAARLTELACRAGGPDNITCVVADLAYGGAGPAGGAPVLAGAVSRHCVQADREPPAAPGSHPQETR